MLWWVKRWQKTSALGSCFSAPLSRLTSFRLQGPKLPVGLRADRCSRFQHPLSRLILAPRTVSPKWTLRSMARGIYRTVLPASLHPLLPIHLALEPQASTFFTAERRVQIMDIVPSQPRPASPRPCRTETTGESGQISEDWLVCTEPKPKTKKVIATTKRLWDKHVIRGCRLCRRGVTAPMADGRIVRYYEHIGVGVDSQ